MEIFAFNQISVRSRPVSHFKSLCFCAALEGEKCLWAHGIFFVAAVPQVATGRNDPTPILPVPVLIMHP